MGADSSSSSKIDCQYQVSKRNNVIQAVLKGDWDMSTDLAYFSELSKCVDSIAANPWGLVVDMREWRIGQVPDQIFRSNTDNTRLNRVKQKSEIWLVSSPTQGFHLQGIIESAYHIRVVRVADDDVANRILSMTSLEELEHFQYQF